MHAEALLDHLSPAHRRAGSSTVKTAAEAHALDAFLAGVERRALRIAQMATRDRDEALDIVQDAMMQLARSYAARPAEEWPPLFHRILDNKIHDWQRRQTVRRRLFLSPAATVDDEERIDPLERIPDPAPDAPQMLREQEAMTVLAAALDALPARQREAFTLRIWHGLSVDDTATAMKCSDGSVKTHLSRALAALRTKLQGVWP
jgi:RNA polymerase sigma-70 factor (ECF subfamily)